MKENSRIKIIYLLGTSFSGSTLVGYLLGSSARVFNAGELMLFSKKKDIGEIPCFCGDVTKKCGFWKEMNLTEVRLYSKPDLKTKIIILLRLILGGALCPVFKKDKWDDFIFFENLLENMEKNDQGSVVILDASKSLFRLIFLICSARFDVKIIYIKRDLLGNMSSFVKNGDSILNGLLNYKLNHFFMPLFLRSFRLDHYYLSYKRLCASPGKELKSLGRYLDIDISYEQVIKDIKLRSFHVFTGSNTRVQFKAFKGIRYDQSWKTRLTRFQQWILKHAAFRSEK